MGVSGTGSSTFVWNVRANDASGDTFDERYDRVTLDQGKLTYDPNTAVKLERQNRDGTFADPVYLPVTRTNSENGATAYYLGGASFDLNENAKEDDSQARITVANGTNYYALSTYPDNFQDSMWFIIDCIFCGNAAAERGRNVQDYISHHTKDGVFDANKDGVTDSLNAYHYHHEEGNDIKMTSSADYYTRELFISPTEIK